MLFRLRSAASDYPEAEKEIMILLTVTSYLTRTMHQCTFIRTVVRPTASTNTMLTKMEREQRFLHYRVSIR